MAMPRRMNGRTPQSTSSSRPAIEPTAQNRYWSRVAESSSSIAEVSEAISADTAAPAMASFTGVAPPRPIAPRTYTTTPATAAPTKANHT